ncbi:MAG TPA: cobalamin-dependent protein [Candidatus Acidoferrum sp.]|nr:cobalamin-dependent protein [Candidatus Acidoferrum sp.]
MNETLTSATAPQRTPARHPDRAMSILLVLPAGERVRVTPEAPEVPRRAMLRFSVLPLTAVAALTPPEYPVRIVDENVEPLDYETACDVVGITFMTALAPRAFEIAAEFRGRGKIVVAGGYHATLCPEDVALHFDAVVVGDAEGAWERLLADIERGELKKVYRQPALQEPQPGARAPHPFPLPIGWGEGGRRPGEGLVHGPIARPGALGASHEHQFKRSFPPCGPCAARRVHPD